MRHRFLPILLAFPLFAGCASQPPSPPAQTEKLVLEQALSGRTLGDGVVVGGRAAISDNVTVGSGAKIAGYSGVTSDVPPGAVYMGVPAGPANEWRRIYASLRKMGKPRSTLREI